MNYHKLIGVRIDTNQLKVDFPIETIEEAKNVISKLETRYEKKFRIDFKILL